MGILNFKALERKIRISNTADEMDSLEGLIYDAITSRGPLDNRQRAVVLKRVVERVKSEAEEKLKADSIKLIESEEASDTLKSIMI